MRENLELYFPSEIKSLFQKFISDDFFHDIQEIRMRVNNPIIIKNKNKNFTFASNSLTKNIFSGIKITKKNIEQTLELITNYSPYAFQNQIQNGFITIQNGHRVGLAGEIIMQDNKIKTIRNISSINFRIAHEIKDCAKNFIKYISNQPENIIIIGPPGSGKTTFLRDLTRILSCDYKISVVDERSEIAACYLGVPQNDLGPQTDILDKCPKNLGMNMLLKTMSPEIIILDEISEPHEINSIINIINSGVKIIFSLHAKNLDDIKNRGLTKNLVAQKLIDKYFFLNPNNKIQAIYNKNLEKIF